VDIPAKFAPLTCSQDGWDYEVADRSKLPAKPVVSVSIITYQHAPFIRQALDSVLMQQVDFPYEICIGEDGSTDGTRETCLEYAAQHPDKIRLFLRDRANPARQQYRVPFMYNGMKTIGICLGKYVAVLEGDDYWNHSRKLQKQVDFLEGHPDFVGSHHNTHLRWEGGNSALDGGCSGRQRRNSTDRNGPKPVTDLRDVAEGGFYVTCTVMFRNLPVLRNLPGFFYRCPVGDHPLAMILAEHGRFGYFPEAMATYRIHPHGVWSSLSEFEAIQKRIDTLEAMCCGHFPPDIEAVLRMQVLGMLFRLAKYRETAEQEQYCRLKLEEYIREHPGLCADDFLNRGKEYSRLRNRHDRLYESVWLKPYRFLEWLRGCPQ
jgi:glycosyltransferase involved in cell wall biosynthesis